MTQVRTINQIARILREEDPNTAITEKTLRRAVRDGQLPHRKVGTRTLLNLDTVRKYYECNRDARYEQTKDE